MCFEGPVSGCYDFCKAIKSFVALCVLLWHIDAHTESSRGPHAKDPSGPRPKRSGVAKKPPTTMCQCVERHSVAPVPETKSAEESSAKRLVARRSFGTRPQSAAFLALTLLIALMRFPPEPSKTCFEAVEIFQVRVTLCTLSFVEMSRPAGLAPV